MNKKEEKLSVVMPCYNEGKHIYSNLLKTVKIVSKFSKNFEIICVNDGSKDNSKSEIEKACRKDKHIKIVSYTQNKGKGYALKQGTKKATGDLIAFADSDLELSPSFLEKYIDIMKKTGSDVVVGSKMHKDSEVNYPFKRKFLSFGYYLVLKVLFRLGIKDTQTGLKLFKAKAVKYVMPLLITNGYAFDIEMLAILNKSGYNIVDAPIKLEFNRDCSMGRIKMSDVSKMTSDTFKIFFRLLFRKYDMKKENTKRIYFFIGTEAELMKMYNVINEAKNRGYDVKIVSNGQNIVNESPYLEKINETIKVDLTKYKPRRKGGLWYLIWFFRTRRYGIKVLRRELKYKDKSKNLMVVHGDTLSTLMGSMISKRIKLRYAHVESGLRSYNWLSPFPEEIDRYFSSKNSVMNFCQTKEATEYAEKTFKGKAVFTRYNTGIEILEQALEEIKVKKLKRPIKGKYFLLAIHRQENLMNADFMKKTINEILKVSKKMHCLFIYHEQTKIAMEKFGVWNKIIKAKNITMIGRQDYISFINIVNNAEFVIGDGCGNQQEFYYLGKPYLIMRTKVEEDSEGLNWNALPFENDFSNISKFSTSYKEYIKEPVKVEKKPSCIVMDNIDKLFNKKRTNN